jgi:hypothetical protein
MFTSIESLLALASLERRLQQIMLTRFYRLSSRRMLKPSTIFIRVCCGMGNASVCTIILAAIDVY